MPTDSTTLSVDGPPSQEAGACGLRADRHGKLGSPPELVPAPASAGTCESPRPGRDEAFWQRFGQALEWTSKA